MDENYNEMIGLINEEDDDQTLFFKHVAKEDEFLVKIDNLLKQSFGTF